MGLFGSRKKAKNVPVTSVTERSQNPEEIKEEVLQSSYDEINEHAEVVERTSEHEEAAEETDPEMESTSPEDGVEAEDEDDDDIRTFIPFRDKPKVAHAIGQTKILAIINQKGGVGKSTTAVNLSAALGSMGKEVLLVDLDPQGNATSGYGIDKRALDGCVYNALSAAYAAAMITFLSIAHLPLVCSPSMPWLLRISSWFPSNASSTHWKV